MKNQMLGGLSTKEFLRKYWQKKPLLIRNAFPNFEELLNKQELLSLSSHEEAQSRLVSFHRGKWECFSGPFKKKDFANRTGLWTLLVQGINHFYPEAEALLKHFNFIPHARLDDLMISFAPGGGGVGPHVDSYDVFLLQGSGKRLWQIAKQKDLQLIPDTPLKILKHFKPEDEWLLEPGDMLYLPPNYAHNGVAVGDSMTYSIGFRAPTHQEIVREFLGYFLDRFEVEGMYADPNLTPVKHPAAIPDAMIEQVTKVLNKIRFEKNDIKSFLGTYLSEPKPNIYFDSPESPLSKVAFIQAAKKKGVRLDLKSQMLFTDKLLFINGESYAFTASHLFLKKLADNREVKLPEKLDKQTTHLLYEWYLNGYLQDISTATRDIF